MEGHQLRRQPDTLAREGRLSKVFEERVLELDFLAGIFVHEAALAADHRSLDP